MVVSSNRSPSPITARPNSNPNQPIRRSFSGTSSARPSIVTNPRSFNPITPANSPADFARSQSVEKGGVVSSRGCEEKENERDSNLKAAKLRSPAKGSKNFMSPTISAASKFTPSPRKKVLVERNDLVRTSMTFLDGKATFFSANSSDVSEDFDAKSDVGMEQKHTEVPLGKPLVCKPVKKVTFKEVTIDSHDSVESFFEKVSVTALDSANVEPLSDTEAFSLKNKPYCSSVESLSDTVSMVSDCVKVEPCSKEKPPCLSNLSPIIAPLDADPSFPLPYDPKTNYLSPRPQFLRYRPNPRIELLQNKENGIDFGETMRLEDIMCEMSENLSDSEVTEESQTEDSKEESDEASSVEMVPEADEGSQKVPDETYLVDMAPEAEEGSLRKPDKASSVEMLKTNVEDPEVTESLPVSITMADEISEGTIETRIPRKKPFLTRWRSISMLLVCLIAGVSIVSVINSPVIDSSVLNNVSFKLYVPSEVATFAKMTFDEFTGKVKEWSENFVSYLSKLIPDMDEVDKLGPLQFINLTAVQDDYSQQFFEVDRRSKVFFENLVEEEAVVDDLDEVEEEVEEVEADTDDRVENYLETLEDMEIDEFSSASASLAEVNEPEMSENIDNRVHNDGDSNSESENLVGGIEIAEVEATQLESSESVYNQEQNDLDSKSESESTRGSAANHLVSAPQASETEKIVADTEILSSSNVDRELSSDIDHYVNYVHIPEVSSSSIETSDDNINVLGYSLIPLAMVVVALFLFYWKHQNTSSPVVLNKKMMSASGPEENASSHQNWPTEVDVVGESCPSEMSSFGKSSYYSRKEMMQGREAYSHERKTRKINKRESLASSSSEFSMGSPSYGSFTMYERIPIKHNGSGDEEIVTPVRRSSRIRSQVTSQ